MRDDVGARSALEFPRRVRVYVTCGYTRVLVSAREKRCRSECDSIVIALDQEARRSARVLSDEDASKDARKVSSPLPKRTAIVKLCRLEVVNSR